MRVHGATWRRGSDAWSNDPLTDGWTTQSVDEVAASHVAASCRQHGIDDTTAEAGVGG